MIPTIHHTDVLLYEQIYQFYRDAILGKRLKPGEKLPSHRALAGELGIGNNTVIRAYEQLIHEGYVKNERRKGLFVARLDTSHVSLSLREPAKIQVKASAKKKLDHKLFDQIVDERTFPLRQWRKCSNWALDSLKYQYDDSDVIDPLKEQLVNYLFQYRGVRATPDRIVVSSGTNLLLFWLAFALQKTHSRIAFEEPCYPRPRFLFSELGYKLHPVPVNDDGVDVKKLASVKADLLYLTPSHQYPTGGAIPVGNRIAILNWAKKSNAYIIEDDFDCEFRYKTKLMPSLQGLDKLDRVIYAGTFSNTLMPSLRVAYMVMPEKFPVDHTGYSYLINTVPYVMRRTLAHFIEQGFWERHLKKMRKLYEEKYYVCVAALKKTSTGFIQFNNTPSGLNILLRVQTKLSERQLISRALESGISIRPISEFYHNAANRPKQPEILFEFGNLPVNQIERVVEKLVKAWKS